MECKIQRELELLKLTKERIENDKILQDIERTKDKEEQMKILNQIQETTKIHDLKLHLIDE